MIKLVIVEDEPLMNQYIVGSVDWSTLGVDLCGVFFNGKTAYEYLKDNEADIVLTDIQMPVMDGITLISKVMNIRPDTRFIVLSNFDEFNMVKNAFKYGATDYILKTEFEPEKFEALLKEIIEKNHSFRKTDKMSMNMREYALKEFFFGAGIRKPIDTELRVDILSPVRVAVLKILNYNKILKDIWNMESELMKCGLANCIEEILEDCSFGEFFFNGYDEVIFVFPSLPQKEFDEKIQKVAERTGEFLRNEFSAVFTMVVNDSIKCSEHKIQYQDISESMELTFFLGCNRLIYFGELKSFDKLCDFDSMSEKINTALTDMDFNKLSEIMNTVVSMKPHFSCVASVKAIYRRVVKKLIDIFDSYEYFEYSERLKDADVNCMSVSEVNALVESSCKYLHEKLEYADVAIKQIENYIRKNYSSNINLKFLSEQFLFSYTDLSRRFQKETGMPFSKFINDVRLTEAMKLIKTTDYRCSDISSMVGYNNYENFSRAFKEKYGKAPNEIRKGDRI